uniref:Ig-like domain-containing protein n=1 Tax=Aquila chrysaetos chrysaetos TaxID=223781 RepID=A0A663F5D9_AQUCH
GAAGSSVTVPTVFPLVACSGGTSSSVVVACLVDGYFPEPVKVTWDSGTSPAVTRTFPASRRPSGTYTLGSQLRVTSGQPDSLQCTVEHPRHFGGFPPPPPPPAAPPLLTSPPLLPSPAVFKRHVPTVGLFHACDVDSVHLVCLVSHFSPAAVTVEWLVDDQRLSPAPSVDPVVPEATGGTFRTSSHLNVSLEDWQQKTFSCKVTHPGSGSVQEVTVFILPPTPSELYVSQNPKLRCLATSLPSDEGVVVSWTRKRGGTLRPQLHPLRAQFNGTFTATSEVPISTHDWEGGETFTCTINHAELPSPISRSISKKPGKALRPPPVYLLAPPSEELSGNRDTLSLTCLVRGFYPEDISVEWQKNQETLDASTYDTVQPLKEKTGDASYFLYSRLVVKREEWNRGTTFVCMVVHEALPMKFIQRSISKSPGKK